MLDIVFTSQIFKKVDINHLLGSNMKKIALGETLPINITEVTEVIGKNKFKVTYIDDDGFTGTLYLDVELPLGVAELKIIHKEE